MRTGVLIASSVCMIAALAPEVAEAQLTDTQVEKLKAEHAKKSEEDRSAIGQVGVPPIPTDAQRARIRKKCTFTAAEVYTSEKIDCDENGSKVVVGTKGSPAEAKAALAP